MKQDPFSGYRALTPKEMAEKLMNPNIPKTEAEHWAVREIEKQRAEIERLCNEDTKTRHALGGWVWVCPDGGDEPTHERVAAVVAEVERLRAKIERLRTVYVLLASEEAGPVDSATCWYEDKIVGCYISREAAEGAAKLLMADWRISEYALEGKP